MQINKINYNQNFKASLGGEFSKVVKISKRAGLTDEAANKLIDALHELCPNKENLIHLYFRKYTTCSTPKDSLPLFRSGVRVFQDGVEKELNIDPRHCNPKDLLEKMLIGVKKLLKNQVKSSKKHILYQAESPKSWLAKYEDPPYYL